MHEFQASQEQTTPEKRCLQSVPINNSFHPSEMCSPPKRNKRASSKLRVFQINANTETSIFSEFESGFFCKKNFI